MGNSSVKQLQEQNKLLARSRLNEKQISQHMKVDPGMAHRIKHIKQTKAYENLVFAGGSTKCLAEVGALKYLEENDYLKHIVNIAGTSGGSLVGMMYAIGYTSKEIEHEIKNINFHDIGSISKNLISDIYHVATEYGLNNGQHLLDVVTGLIDKKTGNKHYTLSDLWKDRGINLVITATDVTTHHTVYFDYKRYPNIPIRILVRMSIAAPPLFCPIVFNEHYLSDGGIKDDCPIHVFDADTPDDISAQLNLVPENPSTLCLRVCGDLPINSGSIMSDITSNHNHIIKNSMDFFAAIIDTMEDIGVERYQRPSFPLRAITIHVPGYPMTKFDLTTTEISELIKLGYEEASIFFN